MSRTFRVLLVEDDDPLRGCLDEFLASQGWSVFSTGLGVEAVHVGQAYPFDFSILDFHLPGMTGLDVLRAISQKRPLPSIMMSGMASLEEAAAAQSAGVFTFLRKPLDLENLRQSLDLLIRHHFGTPPGRPGGNPPGLS